MCKLRLKNVQFHTILDFSMWMGAVDAGKKTAHKVLNNGLSVMVYPVRFPGFSLLWEAQQVFYTILQGGTREIFTTSPDSTETQLVLKSRKGFVKLALQHGTGLVC